MNPPPPPTPRPFPRTPPPPPKKSAEAIFATLVKLATPEGRERALADACADDDALAAEIRALLAAHEAAGDFMNATVQLPPEVQAKLARLKPEEAGERIGPYNLLQQIGEGGFGIVWMAEQEQPVRRRVALKIIKQGMDTKHVVARFEQERQALAMMDHPNIAKVFDAGATQCGRPFFVMELVKGIPITQFCDEAGMGTRERLALFGDVCSALNHAHQKGVIHRDIKPSNVMVTLHGDKPVVKVIDFGIAKATQGKLTDKTLFTRFEQFIGTPVYMSPEQASLSGLDIDTRSDIYALGILLYELLTGKPPFDAKTLASAGYEEMRRIIREVEPPKPSSRLSTVAGEERTLLAKARHIEPEKLHRLVEPDLDWIVMKAIEKDRVRRYETASAFAQDILRFLADEVVSARPPSAGYQFRKFARRNKAALRVATAIAAVLVVATGVSTWQAVRATKAEALAKELLVESEKARADAEAISKFLKGMFESSRPGEEKGGRDVKVADVLATAVKKLETELIDQPGRHAKLLDTLGQTYRALGLARQAIPLQEKVRTYYLNHFGIAHPDTLEAMGELAVSYSVTGRKEEALKMREEVLALSRKVNGPEHPNTLAKMGNLASSYSDAGRKEEALKLQEEVLALSRKVNGREHNLTIAAMHNLASSHSDAGREEEALKIREEALELCRKVNGPEHPHTLAVMNNLALSYSDAGRKEEALKLQEEVLALSRKVNGTEHPETIQAVVNLASSYSDAGRKEEALKMQEEVLGLSRKVNGTEHPGTIRAMNNLALSHHAAGRKEQALKMWEEVLALSRKVDGPEHAHTLITMNSLANACHETGRKDEAIKLQEEVLALRRKAGGQEHPDTIQAIENLADFCDEKGRAIKLREEVLALRREVLGPEHPDTLLAMARLAYPYFDIGRKEEALKLREEVLALRRKVLGPEHDHTLMTVARLADSYYDAGRKDEALKLREELLVIYRKVKGPEHSETLRLAREIKNYHRQAELEEALAQSRKVNGPEHPKTFAAMDKLAKLYGDTGHKEEARKLREELLPLLRKTKGSVDPGVLWNLHQLSFFHQKAGRLDEALKLGEEALAIAQKINGPNDPFTLQIMNKLAEIHEAAGRKDNAQTLKNEVVATATNGAGKPEESQQPKPGAGDDLAELGRQALGHRNAGRLEEAVKTGEELLAQSRKALGPEHRQTLIAIYNLGVSQRMAGLVGESIVMLEKVLELRRKVLGPDNPTTLFTMQELASSYNAAGRKDDATKLLVEVEVLKAKAKPAGKQP